MKRSVLLSILLASTASAAETPRQILDDYATEAARQIPGFKPNAGLGEHFYKREFASARHKSCIACHTSSPLPANRQFDPQRVERRLARDCRLVVGRACSAGEKADLVAYLSAVD